MADHSPGSAVGQRTADRLDTLQQAIADVDAAVASVSDAANTIWQADEPTEAEMEPGYVYMWPDADGNVSVGGLDSETGSKTVVDLNVSAGSDGGLVGSLLTGV